MEEIAHPLSPTDATKLIRALACSEATTVSWSKHARQRMQEREINSIWVMRVLERGTVDQVRKEHGTWRYRVAYVDKYGKTNVVTAIPDGESLAIVTVTRDE